MKGKSGTVAINPDEKAGKLKGQVVLSSLKEGLAEAENNIQKYFAEGLENTLNQIAKEAN